MRMHRMPSKRSILPFCSSALSFASSLPLPLTPSSSYYLTLSLFLVVLQLICWLWSLSIHYFFLFILFDKHSKVLFEAVAIAAQTMIVQIKCRTNKLNSINSHIIPNAIYAVFFFGRLFKQMALQNGFVAFFWFFLAPGELVHRAKKTTYAQERRKNVSNNGKAPYIHYHFP